MFCSIDEICNKDVINIENGCRVGYVCDVEIDMCSGHICSLLVTKHDKAISFRRPDCIKICWTDIVVMGNETILVKNVPSLQDNQRSSRRFSDIFAK